MEENLCKVKIYQEIKTGILNSYYEPGEILRERKLAEDFLVSRTPIREVLILLEKEGWVTILPGKGAVVNAVSLKEMEDILQLRLLLEPYIVGLLKGKINKQKKLDLDKIYELQLKAKTKKEYLELDKHFHITLVEWTENEVLINIIKKLSDKIYRIVQQAVGEIVISPNLEALKEHKKIIDALKENNIPVAEHYMLSHMIETKKRLLENSKWHG